MVDGAALVWRQCQAWLRGVSVAKPKPKSSPLISKRLESMSDLAIPQLPSRALPRTLAFYQKLGFSGVTFGEGYAILERGSLEIHFFLHQTLTPETSSFGCYLRVGDVESIYRAFQAAKLPRTGIPRMDILEHKPWGMREFAVVDEDGSLLRIGQEK
jgi:catechol 2,3-dioxygenase-like lactoylglutathione lyase family enzyme